MENNAKNELAHNVIVTSPIPPSKTGGRSGAPGSAIKSDGNPPGSIFPHSSTQPTDDMSIPIVQQDYQFLAHQSQGQQFFSGSRPPPPIQRSQSLGNAPSPAPQHAPAVFSMGNMHRTPPVSGYAPLFGQQHLPPPLQAQPPPPSAHPTHLPPRQPPGKPRFQTGPSPAAVAYQLSQQIQQYQGGMPDIYSHATYHQTPTYYDPYGHPYTTHPHDTSGGASVAIPYASSFPPQSYPLPSGNLPAWYPPPHHPQTPSYYYVPPPNYVNHPMPIPQGSVGPPQPQYGAPDQFRRHSVPIRSSNVAPGPENEVPTLGGYYNPLSMGIDGGVHSHSAPTFLSSPPPYLTSPSIPRGPPRKPKQSGNALWVGNLPPSTDVAALKDYFSEGAREEIESVFLISRSNCAFVNYRTETGCDEAMARFHNSKFRGTRLVCRTRPRKDSTTPNTGAADSQLAVDTSGQAGGDEVGNAMDGAATVRSPSPTEASKAPPTGPAGAKAPRTNARFRYFILKSLTVEDLELSVKNGVWATQSHNETVLNQAFEAAESVFLIFSANKSGEYYGYARMMSKITSEPSDVIDWSPPAVQSEFAVDLPKIIYTAATETAPKGRIIDDSAQGTIFWEVLSEDDIESNSGKDDEDSEEAVGGKAVLKSWGKPFRVEWISTSRVPFYRTRGLRNSLNSGREVKVARDGTELEESAGRRLVQMFHQRHMPVLSNNLNRSVVVWEST